MSSREQTKRSDIAYERLQHLYEVSKLLTRAEAIDRLLPNVIAQVTSTLPLLSSIWLLRSSLTPGSPRSLSWQLPGESAANLSQASAHAHRMYDYLVPSELAGKTPERAENAPPPKPTKHNYISLPLVAGRSAFGMLQLEGQSAFDELDVMFVNAVANQVAVAVDRQSMTEAREFALDAMRMRAELHRKDAERDRAEANVRRRDAEASERVARQQFVFARDVTASLGEGVIAVNLAERITLFNAEAERLCRCSSREALGRPASEVLHMRCPEDSLPLFERSPFAQVMRQNQMHRSDVCYFAPSGGEEFPVSYVCAPLSDAGRVTGAVLAFRDVIDIKLAEGEQRLLADVGSILASSLDVRETLDAITRFAVPLLGDLCFIDMKTEDGTLQRVAVNFGDEAASQHYASTIAEFAPRPAWRTFQARVLESGDSLFVGEVESEHVAQTQEEAQAVRAVGAKSLMVVGLCARGETLGALTFVIVDSHRRYTSRDFALAKDIGQRASLAIDNARQYETAQKATRARDDLLAVVSHDLKNPLGIIGLSVDLMQPPGGGEDRRQSRRQLRSIRRSVESMNRLIEDLLNNASIDAGKLVLERRDLPLRAFVDEIVDSMQPLAQSRSLQLRCELPNNLPTVYADSKRLYQVFTNLLGNALKFTPPGGSIVVRATDAGAFVQFYVLDTGPGVLPHEIPHLFDRFWQARGTARLGTGLGLAIVRGIIEAHGGEIHVESQVGKGTTFFFTLPRAPSLDASTTLLLPLYEAEQPRKTN